MPNIYRILRNNKEHGPLSLEELLEFALRPRDLVWVDGESSGWRFPTEIEELRKHVKTGRPSERPSATVNAAPLPEKTTEVPQEEAAMQEAEVTDEPAPSRRGRSREKTAPETNTRYIRSVDDLKKEYADWLQSSRTKESGNRLPVKGWQIGLGVLASVAVIYLLSNDPQDAPGKKKPAADGIASSAPVSAQKAAAVLPTVHTNRKASGAEAGTVQVIYFQDEPEETTNTEKEVEQYNPAGGSVDDFIDSIRQVTNRQDQRDRQLRIRQPQRKPASPGYAATSPDRGLPTAGVAASAKTTPRLPLNQSVSLNARYIQGDTRNKVEQLEVTVSNRSPEVLKLVTVDVFYYKKGQKLFDKETLYFNNIPPGNSFTLSTPGNQKATEARFQLGQVTGVN